MRGNLPETFRRLTPNANFAEQLSDRRNRRAGVSSPLFHAAATLDIDAEQGWTAVLVQCFLRRSSAGQLLTLPCPDTREVLFQIFAEKVGSLLEYARTRSARLRVYRPLRGAA